MSGRDRLKNRVAAGAFWNTPCTFYKVMCTFRNLIILISVVILPGTAAVFGNSVDARREDREITMRMLIWEGYAPAHVREAFQRMVSEKFGLSLAFDIAYASNPDAFFNALRKGEVDMISPAHNLPKDLRYNFTSNGLTLPVNLENIPNYASIMPRLRRRPWSEENGQIFAVPIVQGPYGLAYNTRFVDQQPVSWNILWDPRYAGNYAIARDYYELSIYISALAMGYNQRNIFNYDAIKGPLLERRVTALAVNADFMWKGMDKPIQYRHKALATTWRITFAKLNTGQDVWRVAVPREGTTWWIDTLMLSHTLKHYPLRKKIAEEWINFLLAPEVQAEALAIELGVLPVTLPALNLYWEKQPTPRDVLDQKRLLQEHIPWQVLKTRDRNAFHLLWNEALEARSGK